jgi:hypothetical protein
MNPMYVVNFDGSKTEKREKGVYSAVEKKLMEVANNLKAVSINSEREFSYLFRDMSLATHFYKILLSEREKFNESTFEFKKYSLEEIPLTEKEESFLLSADPRDNPDVIGKE